MGSYLNSTISDTVVEIVNHYPMCSPLANKTNSKRTNQMSFSFSLTIFSLLDLLPVIHVCGLVSSVHGTLSSNL